jgi:oligopeptide transport system substrate-binding protein
MNSNWTMKALAGAALLAFAGLAAAATVPAGVKLHETQELVRNNGSEPETLDAALATGVPANNVIREMFEGLCAADNNGKIVPGVAESWKQVDPQTWVFKLRKNAKWSNGDAGDRRRLHLQHAPFRRPGDRLEIRLHLRRLPAQCQRNH